MKKLTLDQVKEHLKNKNLTYISGEYKDQDSKLNYICDRGHPNTNSYLAIYNSKKGCFQCMKEDSKKYWVNQTNNYKKINNQLDVIRQEAEKRGYKLVENQTYINNHTKLKFLCNLNHPYDASWNTFKKGHGCKQCNDSQSEKECRKVFEEYYNVKFPTKRPHFLRYNGKKLELDGYNEELKMAFEYNGEQHYSEHRYFKQRQNLKKIQEHDKFKEFKCKEMGITLIVIPCWAKIHGLKNYILEKIKENNVVRDTVGTHININDFYNKAF